MFLWITLLRVSYECHAHNEDEVLTQERSGHLRGTAHKGPEGWECLVLISPAPVCVNPRDSTCEVGVHIHLAEGGAGWVPGTLAGPVFPSSSSSASLAYCMRYWGKIALNNLSVGGLRVGHSHQIRQFHTMINCQNTGAQREGSTCLHSTNMHPSVTCARVRPLVYFLCSLLSYPVLSSLPMQSRYSWKNFSEDPMLSAIYSDTHGMW